MSSATWRRADPDASLITRYIDEFHLTRPIALVLANRGIKPDEVDSFLRPRLNDLMDPYRLPGTAEAAARLWRAIHEHEAIAIHGDYDTDGVTSTVLLAWVLRDHGARVDCFLPHRINDGYGLTEQSITRAVAEQHRVLITVDCGITSCEGARLARAKGIEVIITDHHEPAGELPDAFALLNPKLHQDLPSLQSLAGVGVSFKLCHGFIKYGREHNLGGHALDLRDGLDLVALGTVADIVSLLGENRCLVRHGMKVLSAQRRPGIRALCDSVRLGAQVESEDIAFRLAPRLNAAGRLGDASDALKLLEARSVVEAYPLAAALNAHNRRRQECEEEAYRAALTQLEGCDTGKCLGIVAKGRDWHRGVIGIVASRLTQHFHRPALVLCIEDGGLIHGSGRSVDGVNLVAVLDQCRDCLERYGGHPMAIGLTLAVDRLREFEQRFQAALSLVGGGSSDFTRSEDVEGDVALCELTDTFFEQLELLKPFGHGNPAPAYCFRGLTVPRLGPLGRKSARGQVVDGTGAGMAFVAFNQLPGSLPPGPWDAVARPLRASHDGESTPQLQLVDARTAS